MKISLILFRLLFFLFFYFNLIFHVNSQSNKLGVAYAYTSLDLPGDLAGAGQINYELKIKNRILTEFSITLLNYNGKEGVYNILQESRKKIGLDLIGKYTLIKYKNSKFNIGIGPSIWYRNENLIKDIKFVINTFDNSEKILNYKITKIKEVNIGYNMIVEIDLNLYKTIYNNYFVKVIDVKKGGVISILGVGVGFKF